MRCNKERVNPRRPPRRLEASLSPAELYPPVQSAQVHARFRVTDIARGSILNILTRGISFVKVFTNKDKLDLVYINRTYDLLQHGLLFLQLTPSDD